MAHLKHKLTWPIGDRVDMVNLFREVPLARGEVATWITTDNKIRWNRGGVRKREICAAPYTAQRLIDKGWWKLTGALQYDDAPIFTRGDSAPQEHDPQSLYDKVFAATEGQEK